jgi:PBP1b-binding outer membrane lipoprotein LpoB
VRYIAAMRTLRPAHILLIACFLPGCSAPAPAQPPTSLETSPPAPAAAVTPTPAPAETKPAEPVDIRGRVIQARRNAQGEPPVGTLQVEGALEPGTRYDKATIRVGHETQIFLGRGGKRTSFSFIHSGDLVEVTFTGPVAESYPVQATADRIVILEHTP